MANILQELMPLAGVPLEEAETPNPQLPNLNLDGKKIVSDDDPEKLKNFWNWFGNSTTAWNGRPMVFYHGTQTKRNGKDLAPFTSFDKTKLGKNSHFSSKVGFFFTDSKMSAGEFGSRVMPVYLKMTKPKIYSSGSVSPKDMEIEQEFYNKHKSTDEYTAIDVLKAIQAHTDAYDKFVADIYHKNDAIPYERNLHNSFRDAVDIRGREQEFIANYVAALKSEGYDSIIIRNTVADASKNYGNKTTQYCVFDPEQIKSVDNSGEFSPVSSNIYESIEYAHMEPNGVMFQILKNPSYDEFWELLMKSNAQRLRGLVYNDSNEKLCFVWDAFYGTMHYLTLKTYLRNYDQNIKHWAQVYCDVDSYTSYGNCPDWFLETYYPNLAKTSRGSKTEIEETVAHTDSMSCNGFDNEQRIIHKVETPNIKFLMGEKELMRDQSDYVRLRIASIIKDMIPDLKSVYFTISGKEFYDILTDKLGSPKKASLLLHKYGIKGIRYAGSDDGEYAVIFNPEDLSGLKKFYG